MIMKYIVGLTLITGLLLGCQDQKFSGYTGEKKAATATPPPAEPPQQTNPYPENQPPQQYQYPQDQPPLQIPWNDIFNTFQHQLDFGKPGVVWHVGDGNFSGSSCRLMLRLKQVKGLSFRYNFEVVEDFTKMRITIKEICGVDGPPKYNSETFAFVRGDQGEYDNTKFTRGQSRHTFARELTLNRGQYHVFVETRPVNQPSGSMDADDFLVGNIVIDSDKPIRENGVTN